MQSVLIISTSKAHTDAQDALRLGDWATAFSHDGWKVDIIVPRKTALIQATLPIPDPLDSEGLIRVFTAPPIPFTGRHFAIWRAGRMIAANRYSLVLGIGDGALIARAADRTTIFRFPYMVEILRDTKITAKMIKAMKHASCVTVLDDSMRPSISRLAPKARLCTIGEPRYEETSDEGVAFATFRDAVRQTSDYAMEFFAKKEHLR